MHTARVRTEYRNTRTDEIVHWPQTKSHLSPMCNIKKTNKWKRHFDVVIGALCGFFFSLFDFFSFLNTKHLYIKKYDSKPKKNHSRERWNGESKKIKQISLWFINSQRNNNGFKKCLKWYKKINPQRLYCDAQ